MSENKGFVTTKKERFAYCLFFLGQNILWGYAGYVETFLTDIGIAAGPEPKRKQVLIGR